MIMENLVVARKFTYTDEPCPDILGGGTPLDWLKNKLSSRYAFEAVDISKSGIYKEAGWMFDFRPFLGHYVVRTADYLYETYGVNKTQVRKSAGSRVFYILEIPKKQLINKLK